MSSSITIDDLDATTWEALRAEADRRGVGVAAVAREALLRGLPPAVQTPAATGEGTGPFHDLDHLAGTWSEEDEREFEDATADFRRIDEDLWK